MADVGQQHASTVSLRARSAQAGCAHRAAAVTGLGRRLERHKQTANPPTSAPVAPRGLHAGAGAADPCRARPRREEAALAASKRPATPQIRRCMTRSCIALARTTHRCVTCLTPKREKESDV